MRSIRKWFSCHRQHQHHQQVGGCRIFWFHLESSSFAWAHQSHTLRACTASSILTPSLCMMIVYIALDALVLHRLGDWLLFDGIFFCFMALSSIGFGMAPQSGLMPDLLEGTTATLWFRAIHTMSGMALTSMCFDVFNYMFMHRIKHFVDDKRQRIKTAKKWQKKQILFLFEDHEESESITICFAALSNVDLRYFPIVVTSRDTECISTNYSSVSVATIWRVALCLQNFKRTKTISSGGFEDESIEVVQYSPQRFDMWRIQFDLSQPSHGS